MNRTYLTSRTM